MQNWFFFLVLGKWRPTLMKRFPQSHTVGQGQSRAQGWVSGTGTQTLLGERQCVSWQSTPIHMTPFPSNISLFFSCRYPGYFPVTSGWRAADRWWWITQTHSAWGSPPETSLLSLPRLCCLPQASSWAMLLLFHSFSPWLKSEVRVLFYKHTSITFETPLGTEYSNVPLRLEVLCCYFLVVKLRGFVGLVFWGVYGVLFVCLFDHVLTIVFKARSEFQNRKFMDAHVEYKDISNPELLAYLQLSCLVYIWGFYYKILKLNVSSRRIVW